MALTAEKIQKLLKANNYYTGNIDGNIGVNSIKAITTVLTENKSKLPLAYTTWPISRQAVLAAQILLSKLYTGNLDGYNGMLTDYAYSVWEKPEKPWRPDDNFGPIIQNNWGSQATIEKVFGPAGGSQCTAGKVKLPYKMRIAWDLSSEITTFSCNIKIADSATRAFNRVVDEYSMGEIKDLGLDLFGGCYNYRKKRGGTTLSMHAYGVAIDIDPERNQLKWNKPTAKLSSSAAKKWFDAWYSEGWISLGVEKDFDWMHIQAPKI